MKYNGNTVEKIKNKMLTKSLSILAFTFTILALVIIIKTPPASGYELSLYAALPESFWIFLLSSIVASIIIIILSAVSKKYNCWYYGFLSLSINYFLLLLLPTLRNYVLIGRGQGDILVHIGWVKGILSTGHISESNFYPITHILLIDLKYIGLSLESAANFMSAYFSVIYIFLIFLMAKSVSKNHRQALFILAFASPLLFSGFHVSIHPAFFSIFMLPLLLYSFHRMENSDKKNEFKIIMLIVIFLFVFFHPVSATIAITILSIFTVICFFKNKLIFPHSKRYNPFGFAIILGVSFFAWVFSADAMLKSIGNIFYGISSRAEITIAKTYLSTINKANLPFLELAQLSIYRYGPIFIYLFISFLCLFFVLKNLRNRKTNFFETSYSLQFLAGFGFAVIFLFGYFIEFEPIRISRYAIVMATILCGIVFYKLFSGSQGKIKKGLIVASMIIIICSAGVLGTLNIYHSSRVSYPNSQLTYMENNGLHWFLESRNINISLVATYLDLAKNEIYYFGFDTSGDNIGKFEDAIPSHFEYDKNITLIQTFDYSEKYMITNEFNRQFSFAFLKDVRSKLPQYLKEDFFRLNSDFSVDKIYENSEFECWLIGG